MKKINKLGLESLRTLAIVRRDSDSSSNPRLVGRLSGKGIPSGSVYCLIGLHESWLWCWSFDDMKDDGLLAISADNCSLQAADEKLYLLPPEFQPPISFLLLDESITWTELAFQTGLAASSHVTGTDGKSLQKIRPIDNESELLEGETLQVSGWDHEHCSLCNKHITPGLRYFFKAWGGGSFLCEFCHDRFAKTHSVREVIYPGESERIGEED